MDQSLMSVGQADLQRAQIAPDALSRIVMQYTQQGAPAGSGMEVAALMAALLKSQVPANCRYNVYAFNIACDAASQAVLFQMLPQNLNRKFLLVQQLPITVNSASLGVLFEEQPTAPQLLTNAQGNIYLNRSFNVHLANSTADTDNRKQIFTPPPTNAVSIIGTGIGGAGDVFAGIVIEGS